MKTHRVVKGFLNLRACNFFLQRFQHLGRGGGGGVGERRREKKGGRERMERGRIICLIPYNHMVKKGHYSL